MGTSFGKSRITCRSSYEAKKPSPLIVLLRDKGSNTSDALKEFGSTKELDLHKVLVVASEGAEWSNGLGAPSWRAVIEDVNAFQNRFCIDLSRVYLVSQSSGIRTADKLNCRAPGRFAALATISGRLGDKTPAACEIPRIELIPTEDPLNPLDGTAPAKACGGISPQSWSLQRHRGHISDSNACRGGEPTTEQRGGATCLAFDCEVPYESCTTRGSRLWNEPTTPTACPGAPNKTDRWAVIWPFLSQHRTADTEF